MARPIRLQFPGAVYHVRTGVRSMNRNNRESKDVALLLQELFSESTSEDREIQITEKLREIVPDPYFLDYIYHSIEFYDSDGKLDHKAVVNKGFAYKGNVIAL